MKYHLLCVLQLSIIRAVTISTGGAPGALSVDTYGGNIPLCENSYPESYGPGSSCWGSCAESFNSTNCDPVVADWTVQISASTKQSTLPGLSGCDEKSFRFLCIMTKNPARLCKDLPAGSLDQGESCWTNCGTTKCSRKRGNISSELYASTSVKLLRKDIYSFAPLVPEKDLKIADCSAAEKQRRLCQVSND